MNKREAGRAGGLARGNRYKDKKRKAQELYITKPFLSVPVIAKEVGMCEASIFRLTKNYNIKALRFSRVFEDSKRIAMLTDEEFDKLLNMNNLKLQ